MTRAEDQLLKMPRLERELELCQRELKLLRGSGADASAAGEEEEEEGLR